MARVHILGASGSGTSTLGANLARHLACPHVDADSLFWMPTDPPFTTQRPSEDRQTLLLRLLPANGHWIFSGSATGWATALEPFFDLVVFLTMDRSQRLERLRRREYRRQSSPSRDGPMSPCCAARSISGGLSAELGSSSPGYNREPTTRHLKLSRMPPVRAANSSFWSSFVSSDVCTITIRVLGLTVTNWPRKPLKKKASRFRWESQR